MRILLYAHCNFLCNLINFCLWSVHFTVTEKYKKGFFYIIFPEKFIFHTSYIPLAMRENIYEDFNNEIYQYFYLVSYSFFLLIKSIDDPFSMNWNVDSFLIRIFLHTQ